MSELNKEKEDFKLTITKKDRNFKCEILIDDEEQIFLETKYFSHYKKLIKFLRNFFKSSIQFNEAMNLLKELELKSKGSE
ncbi:hypothetical protein LCGC14_2111200 [marine sediment metagenome]|uniref:Uncharacterized protein n=1 Tax=marine sediment metagenome TaxID=412755 RepID=A0A0F9E754_9ZZZZ